MSMTHNPPSEWFRIFLILLFLIILLIGLIGNSLVLLSVLTSHIQIRRSPTNLLLVNLSCADLIILIFNIFDVLQLSFDRSWPTAWHLGLPLCKIVRFAQVFGCYVSVQTLLVISIERYISIIHPIRLSRVRRRQHLCALFLLIWLLGLLIASPNLYLLQLHVLDQRSSSSYVCGLSDHWVHSHWITVYKYLESIVFFFLPAVIQTILYFLICRKIFLVDRAAQVCLHCTENASCSSRQGYCGVQSSVSTPTVPTANQMRSSPVLSPWHLCTLTSHHGNLARKKAIIMLLLVAISYFIAFSPAQINFLYTQFHRSHPLYEHRLFFVISILLALSSTAFHPILFYIFTKYFRHNFIILFRCLCPVCRTPTKRSNTIPMM